MFKYKLFYYIYDLSIQDQRKLVIKLYTIEPKLQIACCQFSTIRQVRKNLPSMLQELLVRRLELWNINVIQLASFWLIANVEEIST